MGRERGGRDRLTDRDRECVVGRGDDGEKGSGGKLKGQGGGGGGEREGKGGGRLLKVRTVSRI